MQNMRRTRPPPRSCTLPPAPDTPPMELAQTLEPAHLVADLKVFKADDAFVAGACVVVRAVLIVCLGRGWRQTVFFCRVVDEHALLGGVRAGMVVV